MQEASFISEGFRLTGGIVEAEEPKAVVICCHGMPSSFPDAPDDPGYKGLASDIADAGYRTCWFNFRGVRGSEGHFTLGGWMNDLHAVVKEMSDVDIPLYVIGSSAGGAVALLVASETTAIDGVATLAAPAAWRSSSSHEEFFNYCAKLDLIDPKTDKREWWAEFDANRPEWAATLMGGRPLLVMHGDEDRTIPLRAAERLFAAASEPRILEIVPGAGHRLRLDHRVIDRLTVWLDEQVFALDSLAHDRPS